MDGKYRKCSCGNTVLDKVMINLKDYLTSSGKYPERETHADCTAEVIKNAKALLDKVNLLIDELGLKNVKVSSGFRTSEANAGIKGAAKKSLHMRGSAIDLVDKDGSIDKVLMARPELLKKYGLWLEHPDSTVGWTHIDIGVRTDRAVRVFKP